ncbi:G-protein gamma subunit [Papiliotrema laurentii]|uniref:Guanine nucleotide-binding protein subunit gamma n=1 Tax=Papiliotrema laurentii TaxID=5418 RepID=A0AAD9FN03_PAPLA|nr:G-protein gamma subunit [Papiliotrema laurentii]
MIPARPHKQTMQELKLRRLAEHNARLREDLARPRQRVSDASKSLIDYCASKRDPLLPSLWGPLQKGEDPYAPVDQGQCCSPSRAHTDAAVM